MFQRFQQFIDVGGASQYTIELLEALRKIAADLMDGMIIAPDVVEVGPVEKTDHERMLDEEAAAEME